MTTAHRPRHMLVTGAAGFIGCNFVAHALRSDPELRILSLDALTYAGREDNLAAVQSSPRHRFVKGDICDAPLLRDLFPGIDTVVHFAAESHVDRSIAGPEEFIRTNLVGTHTLLHAARLAWTQSDRSGVRFHHISTDEVFGSLGEHDPPFQETTPYAPNSPYAASKAGSDHLARAYHHTYGLPVTITNCSNNYGPFQHDEKFIPTVIRSCLERRPIPVYGTGLNVRDWLYVDDHCRAIDLVIRRAVVGSTYLVGGLNERRNIDIARLIGTIVARETGTPAATYHGLIQMVTDRLGHDFRYAIDPTRIRTDLGFAPQESFESGLEKTVRWYLARHMAGQITG